MDYYLVNFRHPLPNKELRKYNFLGEQLLPAIIINENEKKGLYRIPVPWGWGLYRVDKERAIYTNGRVGDLYKIDLAPDYPLVDYFPINPNNPIFSEKKLDYVY